MPATLAAAEQSALPVIASDSEAIQAKPQLETPGLPRLDRR
jgi:hypothetical protein